MLWRIRKELLPPSPKPYIATAFRCSYPERRQLSLSFSLERCRATIFRRYTCLVKDVHYCIYCWAFRTWCWKRSQSTLQHYCLQIVSLGNIKRINSIHLWRLLCWALGQAADVQFNACDLFKDAVNVLCCTVNSTQEKKALGACI